MFEIDSIVTLEDGKEYYLMDKFYIGGIYYYYAVEYIDDIEELLNSNYCFLREEYGGYMVVEDDEDIKGILFKRVKERFDNITEQLINN